MNLECNTCGAVYSTVKAWEALPYVGIQHGIPGDPPLEIRNCVCGSTLGVEIVLVEIKSRE